jgi:hypothetical protein
MEPESHLNHAFKFVHFFTKYRVSDEVKKAPGVSGGFFA